MAKLEQEEKQPKQLKVPADWSRSKAAGAGGSGSSRGLTDVEWQKIDKPKFYALAFTSFLGLRILLHPTMVVKTRMQATGELYGGTVSGLLHITRTEGIRGAYKGFGVASLSLLPRQAYFTIYEVLRQRLGPGSALYKAAGDQGGEVVRNMAAGAGASIAMQVATVPIDVVSQRLMVAGVAGDSGPSTATAIARDVYATAGIRGFYRGLPAAVMQFAPTSAVWWSTYGVYKEPLSRLVDRLPLHLPDEPRHMLVQAIAGYMAGATTVVMTNPLDVVRTRLQVRRDAQGATMLSELKTLWGEGGFRALFRGLGPRMVSIAPASVLVVVVYEKIKRTSLLKEHQVMVDSRANAAAAAQLCRRYSGQPL